ncbi:ester cyclase [Luteolibacter arcticus]|uniref:Ester cyclase n=1 Tax=Luteolibacter arcticus TaxID=1581411 RepID=A0ABT3GDD5_9BACT|nr:ester cyclase [Luteolibacter arcticus]MCW1921273.1 ester cyclase [Luteolibacter arcticus]
MSIRTPSEVGRLWFGDMWNKRDTDLLRELMAPDATGIFEGGRTMTGPDDFIAFQREFLEAVPDLKVELLKSVSEGDEICVHWRGTGNHCGPGLGCPPSNKDIEFEGVTWLTVKNGQIVAGQDFWNQGGLMQHVGAV